jgi:hypothetical protein
MARTASYNHALPLIDSEDDSTSNNEVDINTVMDTGMTRSAQSKGAATVKASKSDTANNSNSSNNRAYLAQQMMSVIDV